MKINLISSHVKITCSARYLTRSLRSPVRYQAEHSKIKFVSTRGHVISYIYYDNGMFLSRAYGLIVCPQKFDVLKTHVSPKSEASRAYM